MKNMIGCCLLPAILFHSLTASPYSTPDGVRSPLDVNFIANDLGGLFPSDTGDANSWAGLNSGLFGGLGPQSRFGQISGGSGSYGGAPFPSGGGQAPSFPPPGQQAAPYPRFGGSPPQVPVSNYPAPSTAGKQPYTNQPGYGPQSGPSGYQPPNAGYYGGGERSPYDNDFYPIEIPSPSGQYLPPKTQPAAPFSGQRGGVYPPLQSQYQSDLGSLSSQLPQSGSSGSALPFYDPFNSLGSKADLYAGLPAVPTRPVAHPAIDSNLFAPLETEKNVRPAFPQPQQPSGRPAESENLQGIVPIYDEEDQFRATPTVSKSPLGSASNTPGGLSLPSASSIARPSADFGSYPALPVAGAALGNRDADRGFAVSYRPESDARDKQSADYVYPQGPYAGKPEPAGSDGKQLYNPPKEVQSLGPKDFGVYKGDAPSSSKPAAGALGQNHLSYVPQTGLGIPSPLFDSGLSAGSSEALPRGGGYDDDDDNLSGYQGRAGNAFGDLDNVGLLNAPRTALASSPAAPAHTFPTDVYDYNKQLKCTPQFFLEYNNDFSGSVWQDVKGTVRVRQGRALFEGQGYLEIPFFTCNDLLPRYSMIFVINPQYGRGASSEPQAILGNSLRSDRASLLVALYGNTLTLVIRQRAPDMTAQGLLAQCQGAPLQGGDSSIVVLQVTLQGGETTITVAQESGWIFFGAGDQVVKQQGRLPTLTNEPLYVGAGADPRGGKQLGHYSGTFDSFLFDKCP